MTYEELTAMLDEVGLPYAYDHFAEGETPKTPYMVYYFERSNNFSADGKVWVKAEELTIALYMKVKNPEVENQLETVLDAHDIYYEREESWFPDEAIYQTEYNMEVIRNGW